MPLTTAQIQNAYVAFFNRPADKAGLTYWSTYAGNSADLLNTFAQSNEYKSLYAGLNSTQIVNAVYSNLFGRTPDVAGLTYWTTQLDNGKLAIGNIADAINKGAQGSDATIITNKVTAATAFTDALDTTAEIVAYSAVNSTGMAAVKAWLNTLNDSTKTAASITTTDLTTVLTTVQNNVSSTGSNYTLTTGTDAIVGTKGNDTITAGALAADGTTAANTLSALDSIDGGDGTDTLVLDSTGNKNSLTGTITNIENLTYVGSGAAINGDATIDLTNYSGKFTLSQTADTAVAVSNVKAQTLALNKVADGTTLTAGLDAAQTSLTLTNAAAVGDATFSVSGTTLATVNLTTDKTATGKTLTVTDTGNTTKTLNVEATGAAAVSIGSNALEAVVVTGTGVVTLTAATAPSKSLSSVNATGGVTYAVDLVAQQFTGGAGKDTVQFGATTKAQTLGAGDDTATISADLATGGTIDAGDGTDTLGMTATLAATLDDNTNFNAKVSGFEKLKVTTATNQTLNLTNLDGLNYVIETGTGNTLTLDNMASGGTIEFTDTSTATAVNIKDASTGTADILNVKATAAATFAAGTLTVANVETVNIESDDTATAPAMDGSVKHTLTLTADKATKVTVTGDASLNLTLTGSTKVTTIDPSAAKSGFTTNLSVASGITLTGTAKADTITLGQLSVVTGGAGTDVYTITTPTNGNTYSTIADFAVGETIQFTDKGNNLNGAALGTKISLAATAAFADYLAAAAAADGSTDGVEKWFQYGGDTYVVHDVSAAVTFQNGADEIVKLTGTLDLSKSTVSAGGLLTYVAA